MDRLQIEDFFTKNPTLTENNASYLLFVHRTSRKLTPDLIAHARYVCKSKRFLPVRDFTDSPLTRHQGGSSDYALSIGLKKLVDTCLKQPFNQLL